MAYNTALRMTLLLLSAGYICQLSTGAEDTQTCDADHTIITRAVYDDSHHSGPQPLNSTDLLQVYDVCLPKTPRQVSNLPCAGFNFDPECVGGVHHDPCYWLETNVQNITLRRHWKMAATLPPGSTPCKCKVSSAVPQHFHLTAVNLYDDNINNASRITVYAKTVGKYIDLNSMEPLPKPKPVKASKTLVVKFANGAHQALQILTIKAANARVNVSCEGSNYFATTLPSDLHDVTSVTKGVASRDKDLSLNASASSAALRDFLVGMIMAAIAVVPAVNILV
ncbi:uncharacterized protein [Littorina saxatilis]|uniref:Uncharacterized protein n=1 Tax=Littorina saxatilis TaxID=31220 RepID=A0AAN9GEY3_9CAEN